MVAPWGSSPIESFLVSYQAFEFDCIIFFKKNQQQLQEVNRTLFLKKTRGYAKLLR